MQEKRRDIELFPKSLRNHDLVHSTRAFIRAQLSLDPSRPIVVGLSGGVDSCALVVVLRILGFPIIAAHCNFHLRGEESDEDERFVLSFCRKYDIPCRTQSFDTRSYAENHRISIETAARDLRYSFFDELLTEHSAQAVAVAHHLEDNLETFLGNVARGSGIRGLRAILPERGTIVRPFLEIPKWTILAFAKEAEICYREDSTNADIQIRRNYIRKVLRPSFDHLNPSFDLSLRTSLQHCRELEKIYQEYIASSRDSFFDGKRVAWSQLRKTLAPHSHLYELLTPMGFSRSTIEEIFQTDGNPQSTAQWESDTHMAVMYRGEMLLFPKYSEGVVEPYLLNLTDLRWQKWEDTSYTWEAVGRRWKCSYLKHLPPKSPEWGHSLLLLDGDLLKKSGVTALQIRPLLHRGTIAPFGMRGLRKPIEKYLRDKKVDPITRNSLLGVYSSGGDLLWIPSVGASENFRCLPSSSKILQIELLEE